MVAPGDGEVHIVPNNGNVPEIVRRSAGERLPDYRGGWDARPVQSEESILRPTQAAASASGSTIGAASPTENGRIWDDASCWP